MLIEQKEVKGKVVSDYFVEKFKSGIIHVLFNSHHKWIGFHAFNDEDYKFFEGAAGAEDYIEDNFEISPLPKEEGKMYLRTTIQCKDQLSIYFIPFDLIND